MKNARERGITLIALVITVIVLLILAGVAITAIAEENGIFNKTQQASEKYKFESAKENLQTKILNFKTVMIEKEGRVPTPSDVIKLVYNTTEYYDEEIQEVGEIKDETITIGINGYTFTLDKDLNIINGEISKEVKKKGLISDTQYVINNQTLTFQKIVVVGASESLKTVKEGFDYLCDNGYKDNGAIVLKEGSYDTANIHNGTSYNINSKYNQMKISVIADSPGKTYMTSGEMLINETNTSYTIELNFYGIVFKTPVYSNSGNDGFCLDGDNQPNKYFNCVFLPPTGGWNTVVKTCNIYTYNCLFLGGANGIYSSKPLSGVALNCASNSTAIDPANGTKTTCLTNITVDANYNITSAGWKNTGTGSNPDGTQANIGVYGGDFAWPK